MHQPDLTTYDWIVLNSSAGKDSQAMISYVWRLAREQGVLGRLVMVHCDLGRVEWEGTKELAEYHAAYYGIRFEVVRRSQGDLLTHIEERGMFPGPDTRYCTAQHKRNQVYRLLTQLARESGRHVRILNCMGIRADESRARAKKPPFKEDSKASNGKRHVDNWYPIFTWSLADVWARIKATGVAYHYAYDLGMPRVSCQFCIFSPRAALLLAGKHSPELLAEYVRVEKKIGHTLRVDQSLAEIQEAVLRGEEAGTVTSWEM